MRLAKIKRAELKTFFNDSIKEYDLPITIDKLISGLPKFISGIENDGFYQLIKYDLPQLSVAEFDKSGKYKTRSDSYSLEFNDRFIEFSNVFFTNQNPILSKFTFGWENMSSGHRAFLRLYSKLLSAKYQIKENEVLICIDEGDLTFHPQWQKEFLFNLIQFINKSYQGKRVPLLLTSR